MISWPTDLLYPSNYHRNIRNLTKQTTFVSIHHDISIHRRTLSHRHQCFAQERLDFSNLGIDLLIVPNPQRTIVFSTWQVVQWLCGRWDSHHQESVPVCDARESRCLSYFCDNSDLLPFRSPYFNSTETTHNESTDIVFWIITFFSGVEIWSSRFVLVFFFDSYLLD